MHETCCMYPRTGDTKLLADMLVRRGLARLEGALDGLVLAQVQRLDELPDLLLAARVLLLALAQLHALLREARPLVQRLAVDIPARMQGSSALL